MTKEEAIKKLMDLRASEERILIQIPRSEAMKNEIKALDMAIKVLEQQPSDDCVSRADAIHCITESELEQETFTDAKFRITELPPVTPNANKVSGREEAIEDLCFMSDKRNSKSIKKYLIALILSIGCMIFAIANIFIKSEPIRMGIWVVIIIVFALDYIALMDEWMKEQKKRRATEFLYIEAVQLIDKIINHVAYSDIPEKQRLELENFIAKEEAGLLTRVTERKKYESG